MLNADGSLASSRAKKRNLILDQGLDNAASVLWANLFAYAAVGTGTTPVKRDSGTIQFTRSGSTVTADAGFFEAGDVGRLLKFDSGEEMYVTAYTDPQNVTVGTSGALGASEGTIWYVNQTGLTAESKRSGTYGSNSGDNGTSYAAGAYTLKRTFVFSAEGSPVVYNEIGWSHSGTGGANLFGRDIISGGIALATGQQLKVVVELEITIGPSGPVAYSNVITGWTQDGDCGVESIPAGSSFMSQVQSSGATTQNGPFEPSSSGDHKLIFLCTMSDAIVAKTQSALGMTGSLGSKQMAGDSYVTGTFTRTFRGTFGIAEGNSAAIRSLVVTSFSQHRNFRVLLDAAETKDSDHTLLLVYRLTWGRTLVN